MKMQHIRMVKNLVLIAMFVFFIVFQMHPPAHAIITKEKILFEEVTDFICGVDSQEGDSFNVNNFKATLSNLENYPVMVNNYLKLDVHSSSRNPEMSLKIMNVLINPKDDFEINCQGINDLFFPQSFSSESNDYYFEGTIISKSIRYMDIKINHANIQCHSNDNICQEMINED